LEDRLAPATLTVNTLGDSTGQSQLSLRDAIQAVDNGSYGGPATGQVSGTFGSNDTIVFQSGLNNTLSLNSANGPLVISKNVTITDNPTLSSISVNGGSQTGVFEVTSAATATVAGLTITQGKDSTNLFGGIYVQSGAALTINGCTFDSNQSMGAGGGAILDAGALTVTDSTFNANSGVAGGAIDNQSGATATLINCTISGNQATSASGTGGGVANAGTLTLLNTLVAQNTSAGTDPDVVGAFTSSGHNLIGNATGATGLTNGSNGDQVDSAAPFTGDLTKGLANIDNLASTAGLAVGQLVTDTAGALPAGTVIAVLGAHTITLSQAATKSQAGDTLTSWVYADLGPLRDNGGGIQTMALLPTSSAIDAGANSDPVLTVPATDERGISRPQAGTVDIGAFEANQLLVTNLNDSGPGSLRDALTQSNTTPGTVVIDFQAGLTGTISLTTAHLEVVHDDWIRGPGASEITVDGNLNFWCFGVDSQYTVGAPGLHVAIYGLTMTRGEQTQGFSDGRGGAISYRNCFPFPCTLTVANCVIENSVNDGIYAEDTLSVINSQIINNTGAGINGGTPYVSNSWLAGNSSHGLNGGSNLVLTNSTFSGNGGDGVYMGNNDATVTNCTFTGNQGTGWRGGFVINYQDTAILTNCTLVGNGGSDLLSVGGNAIPRNCIIDNLDSDNGFGTITSQGNNLFRSFIPPNTTELPSDVSSPGIGSAMTDFNGRLPHGTYYYVIAAITAKGMLASGGYPVPIAFDHTKVSLKWFAPVGISGVTGYRIFRGTALGGEKLIATVSARTTSFTDIGARGTSGVPLLLSALANNGGPVPTMAPTAAGSVYIRNKANPALAPFLDESGYLRNPVLPGIGAFESISATPNTVSLSPASLPGIDQGLGYSQSITPSGGTGTGYVIGLAAGALAPGLSLTVAGALAGTATTAGSFAFTVTAFDSAGNFSSKSYTLNVNPLPSITTSSLPTGNENTAYSKAILTSGGTGPFTWSYTGTLPAGITFNTSTGTFSGTPAAGSAGTYNNIQVTAADSDGQSTTPQTYSMVIDDVSLGALSFNQWAVNKTGFIGTIAATGTGALTFGMTSGKLPRGMTDSLTGGLITFAGTPTLAGTYTFALKLTDSLGVTVTQSYTIVINPVTTLVWTGFGADANWTTPANWSGGAAPLAGDTLVFGAGSGTAQKIANNDFPNGTTFAALRFLDSGYTINGNDLKLSAGLSSASTAGGTDTVAPNIALTASRTFNIAGTTLIDVAGIISGAGGLTKSGTGTLLLPGPNAYTGITTVTAGILDVQAPAALGFNMTMTVAAAGTLLIDGSGLNFSKTLSLSGTLASPNGSNNWSGKISTLAATSTVNVGAGQSLTLSGIVSGAGGLTANKSGSGTLILTNASTYTGATTIQAGIIVIQNKAALGSSRGAISVASGATLQIQGGLTIAKRLTLNGAGAAGTTGALESVSGNNTWTGTISLAGAATIAVDAGQLTLSGIISGKGSLTQVGAGSLIVSALNTYTGGTTVNGGTLGGGGKIGALLVNSGAALAPSSTTTQILKTGNVAFSAGSNFAVTLNGTTAGTGYDQLSVTGTVNLTGASLNVNLGFTPALGSAFTLIQNDGTDAVVDTFAGLAEGATLLLNGMTFQISYVGGTGNDVVLTRMA
jgi:autotransporter-associated beta strand protein